jgi:hypothetical protein
METAKSHFFIEIKSHWLEKLDRPRLREFGLIMAIFFSLVCLFPVLSGGRVRLWPIPLLLLFLSGALFMPALLAPLFRVWMTFGAVLGYINLRIILGLVFFVLLTPIAILLRLLGKDVLGLKFHKDWATYRKVELKSGDFKKQF